MERGKAERKTSPLQKVFLFSSKGWTYSFFNLTVTQHFTTPAVVVPRNVSCFLFLFHLAEFIHFAQNLFPRGICRRTDSDENVVRGISTKKFALRLIRHPANFFLLEKQAQAHASRSASIGNNSPSRKVLYSLMMNRMYHSVYHACNLEGIWLVAHWIQQTLSL